MNSDRSNLDEISNVIDKEKIEGKKEEVPLIDLTQSDTNDFEDGIDIELSLTNSPEQLFDGSFHSSNKQDKIDINEKISLDDIFNDQDSVTTSVDNNYNVNVNNKENSIEIFSSFHNDALVDTNNNESKNDEKFDVFLPDIYDNNEISVKIINKEQKKEEMILNDEDKMEIQTDINVTNGDDNDKENNNSIEKSDADNVEERNNNAISFLDDDMSIKSIDDEYKIENIDQELEQEKIKCKDNKNLMDIIEENNDENIDTNTILITSEKTESDEKLVDEPNQEQDDFIAKENNEAINILKEQEIQYNREIVKNDTMNLEEDIDNDDNNDNRNDYVSDDNDSDDSVDNDDESEDNYDDDDDDYEEDDIISCSSEDELKHTTLQEKTMNDKINFFKDKYSYQSKSSLIPIIRHADNLKTRKRKRIHESSSNKQKHKKSNNTDSLHLSNAKMNSSQQTKSLLLSNNNLHSDKSDVEVLNDDSSNATTKESYQKTKKPNPLFEKFKKFRKNPVVENKNSSIIPEALNKTINKNNVIDLDKEEDIYDGHEKVLSNNKEINGLSSTPSQNKVVEPKSFRINFNNHKVIFDKEHLKKLQVIGQADQKFIVCKLLNYENKEQTDGRFSFLS